MIEARLKEQLEKRHYAHLYRSRRSVARVKAASVLIEGREVINFSSNDYLGLAQHPVVIQAFKEAADRYGVSGGASQVVSGYHPQHQALEEAIADFTGRDKALLFSSGYLANLAMLSILPCEEDCLFWDYKAHMSLVEGIQLSKAKAKRYLHNDIASLKKRLQTTRAAQAFIMTEGVFSMEGEIAPLDEIATLAKQYNACLIVDDAHGMGVLGDGGRGTLNHFKLTQSDVPLLTSTFAKSFGGAGAFVAGSETFIDALLQFAKPSIYSNSMPPAIAAANVAALALMPTQQTTLQSVIKYFRSSVKTLGLDFLSSDTAIQAFIVGDEQKAMRLHQTLFDKGFMISLMRPPTVEAGRSQLRLSLTASHTEENIDDFLEALLGALL